jgi:hypothetical protein
MPSPKQFISPATSDLLAKAAFGLGTVWGVAGAFKLIFGVQLTLVFLPPLGLEKVAPISSLVVACGCFGVAAYFGRGARVRDTVGLAQAVFPSGPAVPLPPHPDMVAATPRAPTPIPVRPPSA